MLYNSSKEQWEVEISSHELCQVFRSLEWTKHKLTEASFLYWHWHSLLQLTGGISDVKTKASKDKETGLTSNAINNLRSSGSLKEHMRSLNCYHLSGQQASQSTTNIENTAGLYTSLQGAFQVLSTHSIRDSSSPSTADPKLWQPIPQK